MVHAEETVVLDRHGRQLPEIAILSDHHTNLVYSGISCWVISWKNCGRDQYFISYVKHPNSLNWVKLTYEEDIQTGHTVSRYLHPVSNTGSNEVLLATSNISELLIEVRPQEWGYDTRFSCTTMYSSLALCMYTCALDVSKITVEPYSYMYSIYTCTCIYIYTYVLCHTANLESLAAIFSCPTWLCLLPTSIR